MPKTPFVVSASLTKVTYSAKAPRVSVLSKMFEHVFDVQLARSPPYLTYRQALDA